MATVVGIFEDHFLRGKKLPVVKPGTQARRFTHVFDTVKACIFAWKENKCKHYSIASKQSYSIIELAKLFKSKIKYLPMRKGERFASALTKMNLNNKIIRLSAKIKLKDYVNNCWATPAPCVSRGIKVKKFMFFNIFYSKDN
jgi:UDP-glucose 4-epimerase